MQAVTANKVVEGCNEFSAAQDVDRGNTQASDRARLVELTTEQKPLELLAAIETPPK